jgi:hypothetical protein
MSKLRWRWLGLGAKHSLTTEEAMFYLGVGKTTFHEKAAEYGIHSFDFMGVPHYRRADLDEALEKAWQSSPNGTVTSILSGPTRTRRRGGISPSLRSASSRKQSLKESAKPEITKSRQEPDSLMPTNVRPLHSETS